jgi:hypothetical protein
MFSDMASGPYPIFPTAASSSIIRNLAMSLLLHNVSPEVIGQLNMYRTSGRNAVLCVCTCTRKFQKEGNKHSDADNCILTLTYTCHVGSRWYTQDFQVVTADI